MIRKMVKKWTLIGVACILLLVGFAGCNREQTYSFGPKENVSEISSDRKAYLQEMLDKAGTAEKGVSFYGYRAYYDDTGRLVVDGFVRNRTGSTITNITAQIDIKVVTEEVVDNKRKDVSRTVASGIFELKEEDFGTLKHNDSRPWTLIYNKDDIYNKTDDLSSYRVEMDSKFKIVNDAD